ncbi:hypothetical protein V5E97_20695 [Singulisphaera sp. Ch08]|uniref:Uncharacterized protein n=1 Tax=Singulisphaera sp. Ch08 TaxID=3120278 RepID=A0AAU7C6I9_9BACT
MLNRTNRTLSANLNGLNLGTRSIAVTANINIGDLQTLRTRHVHRVVMRDGMHGYLPSSMILSRGEIPVIPGSLPVPSWLVQSRSVRPWGEFAAEMFTVSDRPCRQGESQAFSLERVLDPQESDRSKRERKPVTTGKRSKVEKRFGLASARAAQATAAAILAATGG